jgi:hypothetical protein
MDVDNVRKSRKVLEDNNQDAKKIRLALSLHCQRYHLCHQGSREAGNSTVEGRTEEEPNAEMKLLGEVTMIDLHVLAKTAAGMKEEMD